MSSIVKVTCNMTFGKHKPGDVVYIPTNNGVPVSEYWRRKMKDAKTNKCVTVEPADFSEENPAKETVTEKPKKKTPKTPKASEAEASLTDTPDQNRGH